MTLHIFKNKEELGEGMASWICELINSTLQRQEYFTLALSGGNTPKILFNKLASPEYKEKVNWQRVHFFWGDERAVPFKDDRNNAKMAYDLLIDHLNIPNSQVHIMRTDIEPLFAAMEYSKILHTYFNNTASTFDLVLLGMGDDGHTLSLFPGGQNNTDNNEWVTAIYNENQKMYRITLTPQIVNSSSAIAFMVDGEKKAAVLEEVLEGPYAPDKFPAQIIKPPKDNVHWFLDEAVAKKLKRRD
ncbi:MAG: 6-phosphogluconolactonase [Ginsengibacter sp.]